MNDIESNEPDPETAQVLKDQQRLVNEAIEELPIEFREVIVLRELEELSYKEIAAVAGIPIGTVMSRLARARKRLQLALCDTSPDVLLQGLRGSRSGSPDVRAIEVAS
jgi:RNA polymerase sigma-70 factor (ECF subfamily)